MSKAPKKQLRGRGPKLGGKLRSGKPANERDQKLGAKKMVKTSPSHARRKALFSFSASHR